MRAGSRALLGGALLLGMAAGAQQRAQDRAALLAARATVEPVLRVAALLRVAAAYPGTGVAREAQALALATDLETFPDRTAEIHALALADVTNAPAGFERWSEEARMADLLASAGADLPDAKAWAQDAVAALTEESYRRQMVAIEARYKLDKLTPKQMHAAFERDRATFVTALANVDLRTNDLAAAAALLAEAYRLDPLSSEGSRLRGQLALAGHKDREALDDFEQAEAEGDLPLRQRTEMAALYKQLDGGDEAALNDRIDAVYAKLFPPPFALPPRALPAGGHTALLELFTGSGCQPCTAPDLAVESLLGTYNRNDLVVLEYDEHIPVPDPLANPDSVARATRYGVGTTPEAFLDGEELPVVGASRADAENVVVSFAEAIEAEAAAPSAVHLALTAVRGAGGIVTAKAEATGAPAGATVRFALVEDGVRYSGQNGVRFHRMVVRALADGGTSAAATASFDPARISKDQVYYLKNFAEDNDRFGEVHFLATDIPIRPEHLAVVAWVENPATRAVLNAAFAPVP